VICLDSDSDDDDAHAARRRQTNDDAALAARLQAEWASGYGNAAASSAQGPAEVTWYEAQHPPGTCGDTAQDHCSKGCSFFKCRGRHYGERYTDETAHSVEPRPLAGQTITIAYLPHNKSGDPECQLGLRVSPMLLARGGERHFRSMDGSIKVLQARTAVFRPFAMPRFVGRVREYTFANGEHAYVITNFDGANGQFIAERLEGAFGLDILNPPSGKGVTLHRDMATKLFPLSASDDQRTGLLAPLLPALLAAVNAQLPAGQPKLDPKRGSRGRSVAGDSQVLRFLSCGKGGGKEGNKMPVHVNKDSTGWVAIASLGDRSTFLLDYAPNCERCATGGGRLQKREQRQWATKSCRSLLAPHTLRTACLNRLRPAFSPAQALLRNRVPHQPLCPPCRTYVEMPLSSGDCVLFFGEPGAGIAHGTLATWAKTAPPNLPGWCYCGRISAQFRETMVDGRSLGHGAPPRHPVPVPGDLGLVNVVD